MFQPLVSIIIPTFNRAAIIKIALNSILVQSYKHWECIVVDDGSTDKTLDVLEAYHKKDSRITYFKRQRAPKGAPTCRNIGLNQAKGDYIIYLDSDDYLLPFCLEQRVAVIDDNKDCDFLVFPMGKQENDTIVKVEIPKNKVYLIPFLSANLPWQTMCPIWKTTFIKKIDGFTEGYPRFNDPELMIRALLRPEVQFLVLNKMDYDCVFLPSIKQTKDFNDKTYQSLKLFIPDMAKHLDRADKAFLKNHLVLYLHLWFKYIYIPSGEKDIKSSLKLIWMFKQMEIISSRGSINLAIRLLLFRISNLFLAEPINKLCEKSIYK